MSGQIRLDDLVAVAGEATRDQAARFRLEMRSAGCSPSFLRERVKWLALALVEDAMGLNQLNQQWQRTNGTPAQHDLAISFYTTWSDIEGQLSRWTDQMVDGLCAQILSVPAVVHA